MGRVVIDNISDDEALAIIHNYLMPLIKSGSPVKFEWGTARKQTDDNDKRNSMVGSEGEELSFATSTNNIEGDDGKLSNCSSDSPVSARCDTKFEEKVTNDETEKNKKNEQEVDVEVEKGGGKKEKDQKDWAKWAPFNKEVKLQVISSPSGNNLLATVEAPPIFKKLFPSLPPSGNSAPQRVDPNFVARLSPLAVPSPVPALTPASSSLTLDAANNKSSPTSTRTVTVDEPMTFICWTENGALGLLPGSKEERRRIALRVDLGSAEDLKRFGGDKYEPRYRREVERYQIYWSEFWARFSADDIGSKRLENPRVEEELFEMFEAELKRENKERAERMTREQKPIVVNLLKEDLMDNQQRDEPSITTTTTTTTTSKQNSATPSETVISTSPRSNSSQPQQTVFTDADLEWQQLPNGWDLKTPPSNVGRGGRMGGQRQGNNRGQSYGNDRRNNTVTALASDENNRRPRYDSQRSSGSRRRRQGRGNEDRMNKTVSGEIREEGGTMNGQGQEGSRRGDRRWRGRGRRDHSRNETGHNLFNVSHI